MSEVDDAELTEEQRAHLQAIKDSFESAKDNLLKEAPEHLLALGSIIRRSLANGVVDELKEFLVTHSVEIRDEDIEAFRDCLVVNRIDLKDLEPSARERLRARTLLLDDPKMMTEDYVTAISAKGLPSCRDCRWFVRAPKDGTVDSEKSCVEMGTKGADSACFGFQSQL